MARFQQRRGELFLERSRHEIILYQFTGDMIRVGRASPIATNEQLPVVFKGVYHNPESLLDRRGQGL